MLQKKGNGAMDGWMAHRRILTSDSATAGPLVFGLSSGSFRLVRVAHILHVSFRMGSLEGLEDEHGQCVPSTGQLLLPTVLMVSPMLLGTARGVLAGNRQRRKELRFALF